MKTTGIQDGFAKGVRHLTEEEFGELMSAPVRKEVHALSAMEAHVLECEQCAAELESLRSSLSLFRQATTNFANDQLRQMPACSVPLRRPLLQPAYFAMAAALTLAALLPMQSLYRSVTAVPQAVVVTSAPAHSVESDEALLNDVNDEVSASVPAPMQALADPTGMNGSTQNYDQRN